MAFVNYKHRAIERFMAKVMPEPNSGCWLWDGAILNSGYGHAACGNYKTAPAHRVSYELFKGEIPAGLDIDHTCNMRLCVNPDHLEAVSRSENHQRAYRRDGRIPANSKKRCCSKGHEFTEENTYRNPNGSRCCRICRKAWDVAYRKII